MVLYMSVHSRLMKISNLPGLVMDGPDTVPLGQHGPELPPLKRKRGVKMLGPALPDVTPGPALSAVTPGPELSHMDRLKAFSLKNRNPLIGTAIGVGGLGAGLGLGALLRNSSSPQY